MTVADRIEPRARRLTDSYANEVLLRLYASLRLPPGSSVIEVGSAPGHHLMELHRTFGWNVYGAEYSPIGVAQQRAFFRCEGHSAGSGHRGHVFSPESQEEWADKFDRVLSQGFSEHFADPRPSIAAHVRLAKPGG